MNNLKRRIRTSDIKNLLFKSYLDLKFGLTPIDVISKEVSILKEVLHSIEISEIQAKVDKLEAILKSKTDESY